MNIKPDAKPHGVILEEFSIFGGKAARSREMQTLPHGAPRAADPAREVGEKSSKIPTHAQAAEQGLARRRRPG